MLQECLFDAISVFDVTVTKRPPRHCWSNWPAFDRYLLLDDYFTLAAQPEDN